MNALPTRDWFGAAVAAAALAVTLTACGSEVQAPANDIRDAAEPAPSSEVTEPLVDSRPCTSSIREAHRQHRTLCVN